MEINAMENQTCPAVGYQAASVCVPVTVTPFAEAGKTITKCCGDPVVVSGRDTCEGVKKRYLFFHHFPEYLCGSTCSLWRCGNGWRKLCKLQRRNSR